MLKAELQEKYDALVAEHNGLLKAQAEFIDDLIAVAGPAAIEHELCTELEACLDSLGVPMPSTTVKVERVVTDTYVLPGFQAHRFGFVSNDGDMDDATLWRVFRNAIEYGAEYGGDLTDYLDSEGVEETPRITVLAA